MKPNLPASATQLFVVHVWRQRSRFRAAVRRVDGEQAQLFTNANELARYLAAVSAAGEPGLVRTPPSTLTRRT